MKAEALSNTVDVVVRLHGPTDQAPKLRHLRVLAHVQLDDVPRVLYPDEDEGEFYQHDGVATVMMKLPAQGLAKALRQYDWGGKLWMGPPHMAKDQLVYLWCAPSLVYKVERRGGPAGP